MFHHHLYPNGVQEWHEVQLTEAWTLLQVLESPRNVRRHASLKSQVFLHTSPPRLATAAIIPVAYGKRILSMEPDYVANAQIVAEGFSEALVPGNYLAKLIPFLRDVPSWFPGATATKDAASTCRA